MFTGIIQNIGKVKSAVKYGNQMRLAFSFKTKEKRVQKGESIAVNGVCLTAVSINNDGFTADVVPETLSVTNLGQLKTGDAVNLERSLRVGDLIGGHIVSGHVDAAGKIAEIQRRGGNWSLLVQAPPTIISQLAVKGSITCDGVSLTVQKIMSKSFSVAVIPHTLAVTTLGMRKAGDKINLEIDASMRHLKQIKKNLLTIKKLKKQGF